jgi:hypothetical protein
MIKNPKRNMRKLIIVLTFFSLTSCNVNYPTTAFYVKNNSPKTINFKASVMKYSSMGQFEMTLPFAVPPNDSILARKVGFRKDAVPTAWFTKFIIFPVDSILIKDPYLPDNWIKASDNQGKPIYTFTLTK